MTRTCRYLIRVWTSARFVLIPLSELAEGLMHPTLHRTIGDLAHTVEDREGVRFWEGAYAIESVGAGFSYLTLLARDGSLKGQRQSIEECPPQPRSPKLDDYHPDCPGRWPKKKASCGRNRIVTPAVR